MKTLEEARSNCIGLLASIVQSQKLELEDSHYEVDGLRAFISFEGKKYSIKITPNQ